jgi:prevent-host-death family protein
MPLPASSIVPANDAKTHFAELINRVCAGEEVTITRHGMPVVKMSPVKTQSSVEERKAAIEAMLRDRVDGRLEGMTIKDMIEEGRM